MMDRGGHLHPRVLAPQTRSSQPKGRIGPRRSLRHSGEEVDTADMRQGWEIPFGTGDKQRGVLHLLARTRSTGESQVDRRDALPFDWGRHAVMYDGPESWAAVRGADTNFHKGRGQNTRSVRFFRPPYARRERVLHLQARIEVDTATPECWHCGQAG